MILPHNCRIGRVKPGADWGNKDRHGRPFQEDCGDGKIICSASSNHVDHASREVGYEESAQNDRNPYINHRVVAEDIWSIDEIRHRLCPDLWSVVPRKTHEGTGKYQTFCKELSKPLSFYRRLYLLGRWSTRDTMCECGRFPRSRRTSASKAPRRWIHLLARPLAPSRLFRTGLPMYSSENQYRGYCSFNTKCPPRRELDLLEELSKAARLACPPSLFAIDVVHCRISSNRNPVSPCNSGLFMILCQRLTSTAQGQSWSTAMKGPNASSQYVVLTLSILETSRRRSKPLPALSNLAWKSPGIRRWPKYRRNPREWPYLEQAITVAAGLQRSTKDSPSIYLFLETLAMTRTYVMFEDIIRDQRFVHTRIFVRFEVWKRFFWDALMDSGSLRPSAVFTKVYWPPEDM